MLFGKDVEIIRASDAVDKKSPLPRGRAFRSLVWNQFTVSLSLLLLLESRCVSETHCWWNHACWCGSRNWNQFNPHSSIELTGTQLRLVVCQRYETHTDRNALMVGDRFKNQIR